MGLDACFGAETHLPYGVTLLGHDTGKMTQ